MSNIKPDNHWLTRPNTIRWATIISILILTLTVVAQFFIEVPSRFAADNWHGFGAVFGFICCVAMVVAAKLLGLFLKREEDYYDD